MVKGVGRGRPRKEKQKPLFADVPPEKEAVQAKPKGRTTDLTDEAEQKLLIVHKQTIDALDEKIGALTGQRRAAIKAAKGDGITASDIKHAQFLEKRPDDALAKAKREAQIAKFMNVTQLAVSYDEDRTPGTDKWLEEGRIAGLMGNDAKPPSHLTGVHQQKWMEGYHAGQATLVGGIKEHKPDDAPAKEANADHDAGGVGEIEDVEIIPEELVRERDEAGDDGEGHVRH